MADQVSKFSQEVILPKVRDMDEAESMDPAIVEQLFEQGLMGIEIQIGRASCRERVCR